MKLNKRLFIFVFILFNIPLLFVNADDKASIYQHKKGKVRLLVEVNEKKFLAELYENPTTTALVNRLPLEIEMNELNKNEKYYHFKDKLPSNSQKIDTIKIGDIMLYKDYSFVIFYKTFKTSYHYTPLGFIVDSTGLQDALGDGSVLVKISILK